MLVIYCPLIILLFRKSLALPIYSTLANPISILEEEIISNVSSFINLKHSLFDEIKKKILMTTVLPNHQTGDFLEIYEQSKAIKIMADTNILIRNCGDGVSVNKKAARFLRFIWIFISRYDHQALNLKSSYQLHFREYVQAIADMIF